jgi:hypothetical protein
VDSTPTFFINAKRLEGGYQLPDFEAMLAKQGVAVPAAGEAPTPVAPSTPSSGEASPAPEGGANSTGSSPGNNP